MSHATVWLDHREARIFRLSSSSLDKSTLRRVAHAAHPDDDRRFFADLSNALSGYQHILVTGPSSAKARFVSYTSEHDRTLEERIDGVETVDHPTDQQIVALGKAYFKLRDDSST